MREELVGFGIDPDRVQVLKRGLTRFTERISDPLPETATRFGYLGSLVPHKGVHILVAAFARLPARCSLIIHGDTDSDRIYADRLRGLIGDERVQLAGPLPNADVPRWLSSLHCLVSPSIWWENHPTSVLEAFAAGVPVIGSTIGGQAELLSAGGGLPVRADDVEALGKALLRLACEPGLLGRLADGVPSIPSEADHLDSLDRIYEQVRGLAVLRRG